MSNESVDVLKRLLDVGIMGIVLAWFMFRMERRMEGITRAIQELNRAIGELRIFLTMPVPGRGRAVGTTGQKGEE